jgi:hypothetical protein
MVPRRPSLPNDVRLGALLPQRHESSQPTHESTTIYAKIADIWRASPPPRTWVVALAFLVIDGFILTQAYEAGRAAGFTSAELSR